ncbi:toxin-antitoxin system YwqK family antitoxin [Winogradskyella marincola]|uniref:MORN repeat variant n=1 Tax=Winogradskyella marincola TaxID=3037795 RepID=A0ABT6G5K3_9FLAO|nr:hypothetical protein [Winogradskyella sp. YYF002]MDG4717182.1 hypothetical protein [Winogradskyella sp. YYF002]
MKKLTYILLALVFINCKSEKKEIFQEYNGEMVKVEFTDSKADSLFTGFGGEAYENGKLKSLSYIKNGVPADTLFYYYENGKIKEKGLVENGFQKGWWNYYREDGSLKEKSEWLTLRDSLYKNQSIYFDQNGEIKYKNSSFFNLKIPDTIKTGKNIASFDYNSNIEVYKKLMYVVIENKYSETEIKMDTFGIENDDYRFGIFGFKKGKQNIKGQIVEELYEFTNIGNDSAIGTVSEHKKYFEKEVYVSDKNN